MNKASSESSECQLLKFQARPPMNAINVAFRKCMRTQRAEKTCLTLTEWALLSEHAPNQVPQLIGTLSK